MRSMLAFCRRYLARFSLPAWALLMCDFLDATAQNMVRPYLALTLYRHGASFTTVGLILAAGPLANLFASLVGGSLSDRYGRRPLLVLGIVGSGSALTGLGLVQHATALGVCNFLVSAFRSLYEPALTAALADVTPPALRAETFGMRRVMRNLGALAGPAAGFYLFMRSPGTSFLTAGLLTIALGLVMMGIMTESRPQRPVGAPQAPSEVRSWMVVLSDRALLLFVLACVGFKGFERFFDSYLPFALQDSVPDWVVPAMVMINALMVVLLQLPASLLLRRFTLGQVLLLGGIIYAAAWSAFSVSATPAGVLVATVMVAMGEIVQKTASSVFVWSIAPDALRGRYASATNLGELGPVLMPMLGTYTLLSIGAPGMFLVTGCVALLTGGLGWLADHSARSRQASGNGAVMQVASDPSP